MRKCLLMFALLIRSAPDGMAETSLALSLGQKFAADAADHAFEYAERAWYACISNAPDRRPRDSNWVDAVVTVRCPNELTHALDTKTAAIWIRFSGRVPDLNIANERLKWHALLVDQVRRLP